MYKKFEGNWAICNIENQFFDKCREFTDNDEMFKNFKTDRLFCEIIANDMRGEQFCNLCLENIQNKILLQNIENYKKNDLYGNPPLYKTKYIDNISSGTSYFLSILDRILNLCGDIKNFNICEIGSGYGGQANIINLYGINSYTCIDNINTLNLAKKYINLFKHQNVNFYDTDNIPINTNYDLIISNWCLSEFDKTGIQFYIDNIVSKSRYGYFEMNIWDDDRKSFILNKMKEYFKIVTIHQEHIKTHPNNNFLLTCSKE